MSGKTSEFDRRWQLLWTLVFGVVPVALLFIVINENVFVSIFGSLDSRIELAIIALATSVAWVYWTLRRLKETGILQLDKLPGRTLIEALFWGMVVISAVLYSLRTSNWIHAVWIFIGALFFGFIWPKWIEPAAERYRAEEKAESAGSH